MFNSIISGSSLSEGQVPKKAYKTGECLIQQLSSSLAYLGDSIQDQDHQEPHGAPSKIHEAPELEEKHVTKEVKDEPSHHLFSWGKKIPVDCIVALVDWFAFNLNAAEVYMCLSRV